MHTLDEVLSYVTHFSAVHVGEALLKQNALLLPNVYDLFHNKFMEITNLCGIVLNQDLHTLANPSWLRSQLSSLLEHHMAYQCSVKRNGTVLYRYGGDLLYALNVSLGQARNQDPMVGKHVKDDFQATLTDHALN